MSEKKANQRPKTKRPQRRPIKRDDGYVRDQSGKTTDNDASWYVRSEQLARDVASLQFNNALGTTIHIEGHSDTPGQYVPYNNTMPGIMEIKFGPSVGIAANKNDPINQAGYNVYTTLRKVMSGTRPYEPADLMMYLVAMDSAYMFLSYMQRIYGVAHVYSQRNRYIGDPLIQACGADSTSVIKELASLRAYINMYITRLSPFCTPNMMSYFSRHFFLCSNVYKDSEVDRSQFYVYTPAFVYKWVENEEGGTKLVPLNITISRELNASGQMTNVRPPVTQIMAYGNEILNALYSSEDIATISGDIMKAYDGKLWTLNFMPEDYAVIPNYNEEVSNQIHNTNFCGGFPSDFQGNSTMDAFNVTQNSNIDQGLIICRPYFKNANHLAYDVILDMFVDDPTPKQVMVATRNLVIGSASNLVENLFRVDTAGSEIFLYGTIYRYNLDGSIGRAYVYNSATAGPSDSLDKFRGRPIAYNVQYGAGSWVLNNIWGDIHNYTILSFEQLYNMHQMALSAEFGIPLLGETSVIKE